ncbi:hypothetical protein LS215_1985 [Sulfolobus islandicus L.S.2.15]|uniref:Uncharacterized protein n=2 Tax=Saccharolobus islandicus TaxID=43080 RepID=C3MRG7_SACI2|nr:hypothetical protein LS215_1985 [Sulfolobus islandicus L.S.2.15]
MEHMGLVRRRENDQTYFYYYENGKKVYLGTLKDRTVIDKIRYIGSHLDYLSDEEKKEFLEWANELYSAISSILGKNNAVSLPKMDCTKLDEVLSILKELKGKEKTTQDLDKVYDFVKDDLGYATIKDLREQLGMSLEEFMREFRDYIINNYELIQGGKEGIVIKGIMYGIIRRKK